MYESKRKYAYGTGRRKSSIARVRVYENGTGSIIINGRDIDDYFGLDTLKLLVRQPLVTTDMVGKVDIICTVAGGGPFAAAAVLMIIMKRSCKFSCIIAAMCHTLGQLAAACVLTGSVYTLAYVVVLMPVSIFTGFLTGTVLQALQGFLDDRKVVK